MRYAVQAAPPQHFAWLCNRVQQSPSPFFQAIEAVDSAGEIRGMAGFDAFTRNSAQLSVAVAAPIVLRALLRPSFEYLFGQLGKKVALAIVSSANVEALRLDARLGFREVYRVKDGHSDGIDLVLLELRDTECRWLSTKGVRHG